MEDFNENLGCIQDKIEFKVGSFSLIADLFRSKGHDIHHIERICINNEDYQKICLQCHLDNRFTSNIIILRKKRKIDFLPYQTHTNWELKLMLDGKKPFAYFSDTYPSLANSVIPEEFFEHYVNTNFIKKRDFVVLQDLESYDKITIRGKRIILYALKGEEWRIEAFILLQSIADKFGWDNFSERFLGSLLGYETWQTEIYLEYKNNFLIK